MAGRPFWSGQLKISLVSIGIQIFPARNPKSDVTLHLMDRKSDQRIHHLNVVDGDKPVAHADIVKGFEYSTGKYVILEPGEIKKLRLETQKVITVAQFVDARELPSYLFEKPLPVEEPQPRPKLVSLIDALKRSIDASPSGTKRSAKKGPLLLKSGKRSRRAA